MQKKDDTIFKNSTSLLSEENLNICAKLNLCKESLDKYTEDNFEAYRKGALQIGTAIINKIKQRQIIINNETDQYIRNKMIDDLLFDL